MCWVHTNQAVRCKGVGLSCCPAGRDSWVPQVREGTKWHGCEFQWVLGLQVLWKPLPGVFPRILQKCARFSCLALLTDRETNPTTHFSKCLAPFFYRETVENQGTVCFPKACGKCLFAALQGLNQSLLASFQSIEFLFIYFLLKLAECCW